MNEESLDRRAFLKASGAALGAVGAATVPAAADGDVSTSSHDIGVGDTVRAYNDANARIFDCASFSCDVIDKVGPSTGGTVEAVTEGSSYTWYKVDWNVINASTGWTPETDVYKY